MIEIKAEALRAATDACQVGFNKAFMRVLIERLMQANQRLARAALGGDLSERRDPLGRFVQAGQGVEFPAARVEEGLPRLDGDFLERLEAVRDEAGADDVDALQRPRCASSTSVGSV